MFSKLAFGSCTEFLMKLFRICEKGRQVCYLSWIFKRIRGSIFPQYFDQSFPNLFLKFSLFLLSLELFGILTKP
jgi:hypothetical protein